MKKILTITGVMLAYLLPSCNKSEGGPPNLSQKPIVNSVPEFYLTPEQPIAGQPFELSGEFDFLDLDSQVDSDEDGNPQNDKEISFEGTGIINLPGVYSVAAFQTERLVLRGKSIFVRPYEQFSKIGLFNDGVGDEFSEKDWQEIVLPYLRRNGKASIENETASLEAILDPNHRIERRVLDSSHLIYRIMIQDPTQFVGVEGYAGFVPISNLSYRDVAEFVHMPVEKEETLNELARATNLNPIRNNYPHTIQFELSNGTPITVDIVLRHLINEGQENEQEVTIGVLYKEINDFSNINSRDEINVYKVSRHKEDYNSISAMNLDPGSMYDVLSQLWAEIRYHKENN